MKSWLPLLIIGALLIDCKSSYALTTSGYNLLEESVSLSLTVLSLILAITILHGLRGGVLGRPWAFFIAAFILAGAASLLRLFDLKAIFFVEYDLRPALLVTRSAAMLFMLVGLIFYKKELQ